MDALAAAEPFIMIADGTPALFVPSGLKDGPLPTHYEPMESPVPQPALSPAGRNPAAKRWEQARQPAATPRRSALPACADHLPPDRAPFRRHADALGAAPRRSCSRRASPRSRPSWRASWASRNTDWVVLSTLRGEIETKALVTDRLRPFR